MQCFAWLCGEKPAEPTCCPPGSWPALKVPEEYTPKGSESMLGDLKIYAAGQPGSKGIIVMPEVFGWNGRLKGICDTFADQGFYVIMPDCHRGDTATGKADVIGPDFQKMMSHFG